jgi:hypothetical protein
VTRLFHGVDEIEPLPAGLGECHGESEADALRQCRNDVEERIRDRESAEK